MSFSGDEELIVLIMAPFFPSSVLLITGLCLPFLGDFGNDFSGLIVDINIIPLNNVFKIVVLRAYRKSDGKISSHEFKLSI